MPIICAGKGHSHDTVDEVRACQGAPPRIRPAAKRIPYDHHSVTCDAHGVEPHSLTDQCIRPQYVRARDSVQITEGMWKLGDRIFKVQVAHHGSGRLYGKELIITTVEDVADDGETVKFHHHDWKVIKGAVRKLSEEGGRKMTLQEAKEFGALYGFCCNCGRILTDEKSIEAGIGPVCAQKFA
jgi:hypothetical protein